MAKTGRPVRVAVALSRLMMPSHNRREEDNIMSESTNAETVTVKIGGWASIGVDTTTEVEVVTNEDGSIDHSATLDNVTEMREKMVEEIQEMNVEEIIGDLCVDPEVTYTEIAHSDVKEYNSE